MGLITGNIREQVRLIPKEPGVYQYFNSDDKILYIGKAKNLRNRVSSYFNTKSHEIAKVNILVRQIHYIKYIVVDTETDALLLENNLVKKYQPKYNVLLKDDKTFPWICIKKEPFPRLLTVRKVLKDGSDYFGPYTSGKTKNTILELIHSIYKLRTCKHNLSKENIENGKFSVCLEYHIKKCQGPCEGLQSEEDYNESINQVKNLLKGNISSVIKQLKEMMFEYSKNLEFENAQMVKEKIDSLEQYQSKSTVVSPNIHDVDVFSIVTDEKNAYINFLYVVNGAIIRAHTVRIQKKLDESDEELLEYGILELKEKFNSTSKELILPFKISFKLKDLKITVPQIGDKKKLLELSQRNAKYFRLEYKKALEIRMPETRANRILETMRTDLRMKTAPKHIECFDNSNIQGTDPVAAMVVFKNTKPAKNDYRHYNIKTVEGPDDYASMAEVVYRRYKRLLDEDKPLPQLVVIDGGKGQLGMAVKSLSELHLLDKIQVIGIAKRLEEIFFPGDPIPLYLDKNSETLKIIQRARNEAHRFGITHHRNKRSKRATVSELDSIKGIGDKTKELLLRKYKSVNNVKKLEEKELSEIIGKTKSKIIINHFKNN